MASVNKVILVGNLGADPEVRYLPSGEAVTNLRLATTDTWKDKEGSKQETTEWHRVSFFGRQAEVCGQYLKKGSSIYVEGSIRTRKYTDKDGNEKYATEIRGERMQMLGGANRQGAEDGAGQGGQQRASQDNRQQAPARSAGGGVGNAQPAPAYAGDDPFGEDIPFIGASIFNDPVFAKAQDRLNRDL